jgi:hypothetical protein
VGIINLILNFGKENSYTCVAEEKRNSKKFG